MPIVALTVVVVAATAVGLARVTAAVAGRLLQLLRSGEPLRVAQSLLLGGTLVVELAAALLLVLVLLGLPTPWGRLF